MEKSRHPNVIRTWVQRSRSPLPGSAQAVPSPRRAPGGTGRRASSHAERVHPESGERA